MSKRRRHRHDPSAGPLLSLEEDWRRCAAKKRSLALLLASYDQSTPASRVAEAQREYDLASEAEAAAAALLLRMRAVVSATSSRGAPLSVPMVPLRPSADGSVSQSDVTAAYLRWAASDEPVSAELDELSARFVAQRSAASSPPPATDAPAPASPSTDAPAAPPAEPSQRDLTAAPPDSADTEVTNQRPSNAAALAAIAVEDARARRAQAAEERKERRPRKDDWWWGGGRRALTPAEVMRANQVTPGPLERPRQRHAPRAFFP